MDRLVVVGSGTVVPEWDHGGSCFFLECGTCRVLIDCGPGAVQSLARFALPWGTLTDLVVTHFHPDHVGALPGLFFSLTYGLDEGKREDPLDVWGPTGTSGLFQRLAAALGDFFLDPGFAVRVHDLAPDSEAELAGGLRLLTHKTPHTPESHAVRLEGKATSVAYTGDTGPSETLGAFLEGVGLLVCECSLTDELAVGNHLSPSSVARLAREAQPDLLVLTHIYPQIRSKWDVPALVRAAGYEGRVEVARDGQVWSLTGG